MTTADTATAPTRSARTQAIEAACALVFAAQEQADTITATLPTIKWKSCTRCGGEGMKHWRGGHNAPGHCFLCGGKGSIPASPAQRKLLEAAEAQATVERCRVMYKALRDAHKLLTEVGANGRASVYQGRMDQAMAHAVALKAQFILQ